MKHLIYLGTAIISITILQKLYPSQDFDIIVEPKWHKLDRDEKKAEEFGGKWILAGSITFKKKAKEQVSLGTIYLQWDGQILDHLIASLYKKNPDKNFLPIESNLICDGIWNKSKQTLILNFTEETTLGPTTIFYLVLTVPHDLEITLKNGSFCLQIEWLPDPFKKCCQNNKKLSLAYNTSANTQRTQKKTY